MTWAEGLGLIGLILMLLAGGLALAGLTHGLWHDWTKRKGD